MKLLKKVEGQSLLEVLASLGAATVIVTSIVGVVINALNNAQYSKNQNLATQYAQEGMEVVRKKRDSNYSSFSALVGQTYCLDKGDLTLDPGDLRDGTTNGCKKATTTDYLNVDSFFARSITLSSLGSCASGTEVKTVVSWGDGKCNLSSPLCHNVTLRSCLTDFNVVPTP